MLGHRPSQSQSSNLPRHSFTAGPRTDFVNLQYRGSVRQAGFGGKPTVQRGKRMDPKRRMKLLWSYLPDWILTFALTGAFYTLEFTPGFKREFDLNDTSIQHSYTEHERIPNLYLCFIVASPLIFMPILNMLTVRTWWDLHNSSLGLFLGVGITGTVTQVIKIATGRPRPDAIARCMPKEGATNNPVFGLATVAICTQTDEYIMRDGWRSFPSAHASLSFASLGFLSFYIAGKLHLFDERGHTGKAWLAVAPITGAIFVAITRTMDYRHHWQDVLVGGVLGLVVSYFSYRQYYPSLEHPLSERPYSPRIARAPEPETLPEEDFYHSDSGHGHTTIAAHAYPLEGYPPYKPQQPDPTHPKQSVYPPTTNYLDNDSHEELALEGTVPRPKPQTWREASRSPHRSPHDSPNGSQERLTPLPVGDNRV